MTIPWTPEDDEARRLLDDQIEAFDVDPTAMTWWERFINWLNEALALDIDATGTGNVVIQILLIAAVGVLVFLLVRYFRPSIAPDRPSGGDQLADPTVPAEQYLHQAQQAFEAEEFDQAYLNAYRFMVRSAAQRQLVDVTPATTATVFGWSLGAVLPGYSSAIADASTQFNQISYGGSVPTREATVAMLRLARDAAAAQPQAPSHQHDPARLMPR
jgi:hypothetical protein